MRNLILFTVLLFCVNIYAQNIQWRGINGSGHYPDTGLLKAWPEGGPEIRVEATGLGNGWGGIVLSDGLYYAIGKKDTVGNLSCIDGNGNIKWQKPVGQPWHKSYPDSRSTPVVNGDKVYAISGSGVLSCFNKTSGELVWKVSVDEKFAGPLDNKWGNSESPLIYNDLVISVPGGDHTSMVALNKNTGETVWQTISIGGSREYLSPIVYKYNDVVQIIGMTSEYIFGVNPVDGSIIWKFDAAKRYNETYFAKGSPRFNFTNSPLYHENKILILQGYDAGCIMLELNSDYTDVKELWMNKTLDPHHHGAVLVDGYVYGSNHINNKMGKWVCLDWQSNEIMWIKDYNSKGTIIEADGLLYTYDEKGFVSLIEPNKKEFKLISSFKVEKGNGQYWAHPTIFNGQLLIRHGDYFAAYKIKE